MHPTRIVAIIDTPDAAQINQNEPTRWMKNAVLRLDVAVQHRIAGGLGCRVEGIDRLGQLAHSPQRID
jgi:hypothetical protein